MNKDHDAVLRRLAIIRDDYKDFFIPLGTVDKSTEAKHTLSSLTHVLYENSPIIKAITDRLKDTPVYVGFDGQDPEGRNATYSENLILMHAGTDEDSDDEITNFVQAYSHELMHLDQDARGLLRESDVPSSPREIIGFLMHNLTLEAAAFATEAITMHYLSYYAGLEEIDPTTETMFANYLDKPGRECVPYAIEDKLPKDQNAFEFSDYNEAWKELFLSFFDPDSKHLSHYVPAFCQDLVKRLDSVQKDPEQTAQSPQLKSTFNETSWASAADLKAITTIPGMGEMFSSDSWRVISHSILAAVTQKKFEPVLQMTRGQATDKMPAQIDLGAILSTLRDAPAQPHSPAP